MATEAPTYSNPDVKQRVSTVLQEIQQVITDRPWRQRISVRQMNAKIPDLADISSRLRNTLYHTPSQLEIRYRIKQGFLYSPPTEPGQELSDTAYVVKEPVKYGEPVQPANIIRKTTWPELHKNALPDEVYYKRLMEQSTTVMRLFAGDTYLPGPAEIDPTILSNAKYGAEQRKADYAIATQAVSEAMVYVSRDWRQVPSQFRDIAFGAVRYEAVGRGYGDNWYRMMLGFYLKGMLDVEFQRFNSIRERGGDRVGVRAHFLMPDGRIGCWADWEQSIRAFHNPDASCSSYNSYALHFWDRVRLSLRPYPDGDDFNHRPIDRTQ